MTEKWMGQPAHYLKLNTRKNQLDQSVWSETLKYASSAKGLYSLTVINHIMNLYGVSREKAEEIANSQLKNSLKIYRMKGKDKGPYQQ